MNSFFFRQPSDFISFLSFHPHVTLVIISFNLFVRMASFIKWSSEHQSKLGLAYVSSRNLPIFLNFSLFFVDSTDQIRDNEEKFIGKVTSATNVVRADIEALQYVLILK